MTHGWQDGNSVLDLTAENAALEIISRKVLTRGRHF